MRIRLQSTRMFVSDCKAQVPWHRGDSRHSWAPLLVMRVETIDEKEKRAVGHAAGLLLSQAKPERSLREDVEELVASVREAAAVASDRSLPALSAFELWSHVWTRIVGSSEPDPDRAAVQGFGIALVERALLDAVSRGASMSFADALRRDLFGFEPGRIHPELAAWSLEDSVPDPLSSRFRVRHRIELHDALLDSELEGSMSLTRGEGRSLESIIKGEGICAFTAVLSGGAERDAARLMAIAEVMETASASRARFVLDGNGRFDDPSELKLLFNTLSSHARGRSLLEHVDHLVQPFPSRTAFDGHVRATLHVLEKLAPCVLDSADTDLESFPRALGSGYRGITATASRGIFRALLNRGLCEQHGSESRPLLQVSSEILSVPVIDLNQELVLAAALGIEDVEVSGVYHIRTLEHLPSGEALEALECHGDLYAQAGAHGGVSIRDGFLEAGSAMSASGFGLGLSIRAEWRRPLELWTFQERA